MNVYVFVDMEGISGISGSEFVTPAGRLYATGRRFYTADVNACVRGCLRGGAETVIVRDGHGGGNHLLVDEMEPAVEVVQGHAGTCRMPGLDECDALILLGYHAMAGTRGALLEHTYSSKSIQNMWLNGRRVGEIGIDAAIGAEHGRPTILVTGDDHACREAEDWIPGVRTCAVKQGLTCQGARLLPLEEAHKRIEDAAAEAVRDAPAIGPISLEPPVTLRKEVIERGSIPGESRNVKVLDGRTFEITADTVEQALFGTV
jgi:D-amino peptidase